jgi:hypothetical protein
VSCRTKHKQRQKTEGIQAPGLHQPIPTETAPASEILPSDFTHCHAPDRTAKKLSSCHSDHSSTVAGYPLSEYLLLRELTQINTWIFNTRRMVFSTR